MITVTVDTISYNNLQKDLKEYGIGVGKALMNAALFTGLRIGTIAKQRLKGMLGSAKHWITGRLASSVHMEAKGVNTFKPEQGSEAGDGNLNEPIAEQEVIVGTNVVYAARIEFGFFGADSLGRNYAYSGESYLRFAGEMGEKIFEEKAITEINKLKFGEMASQIESKFDEFTE